MDARRPRLLSESLVKELTGLSRAQLARLIEELGPRWELQRQQRLARSSRVRAVGAGRKPVPFVGRLVMTLVRLRWNLPYRMLGEVFGVSKDTVQRSETEIVPLLADLGITAPDGRRVRDKGDLAQQLVQLSDQQRSALLDGSFVPVSRPSGRDDQKAFWSFHRHTYAMNFQAISDDTGALLWVGGVGPGNTHDITAIATSEAVFPLQVAQVPLIVDKGYIGLKKKLGLRRVTHPMRKRSKHQPALSEDLTQALREVHADISRTRVRIENAFADLKRFKILRGWRAHDKTRFEVTLRAVVAVATLPA